MKGILTIVLIVLSSLFGRWNGTVQDIGSLGDTAVIEETGEIPAGHDTDVNRAGILPTPMARISGESDGHAPSVRNSESGRRIQPSSKSSLTVIKAGKVINRGFFLAFRASIRLFPSGMFTRDRYIHSICQLLI